MAPRASWKGTLNLAQMSCAIKLFAATTESGRISFNQLHKTTHRRITMKPVDAILGVVEREDLLRGFQYDDGRYVIVEDAELEALKPEATHAMEIDAFVVSKSISEAHFEASYFLVPDGAASENVYHLLQEVLGRTDKMAIARIILSTRERVIAISAMHGGLLARTLRAPEEVRDVAEFFGPAPTAGDPRLVKLLERVVSQKTVPFVPALCEDRYEVAVRAMIEEKHLALPSVIAAPPGQDNVVDLTLALKASLSKRNSRVSV